MTTAPAEGSSEDSPILRPFRRIIPAIGGVDMQQVAGVLHHHQAVAGPEGGGELGTHIGDAVAAEGDGLAGRERLQPSGTSGGSFPRVRAVAQASDPFCSI